MQRLRGNVKRDLFGPISYVEGVAESGHRHDCFTCPHSEESWHVKALGLALEIEKTESTRLREILQQDLLDLLREHGLGDRPWQQPLRGV